MELVVLIPIAGVAAVLYAAWLAYDVLRRDTGTPEMQDVASMIFEGAMAFLRRQYGTIAALSIVTAVAIGLIVGLVSEGVKDILASEGVVEYGEKQVEPWEEGLLTAIAFLVGAFCSGLAGYIGMFIAVRSNSRTASAATRSLKEAITVSLRGGAVSGFLVVALSLIGVSGIFVIYSEVLGNPESIAPFLIVGFGFGASFVALFAQLGGGIYTKAADVGADLVGKVEAGIPEDDPRNAAVVADLVGDNVGDCAGRGADLFESMSAENIGAMILGVSIYAVTGDLEWILFPLVLRSFGILATIVGLTSVPFFARDDGKQNAMTPLNNGYFIVSALSVVGLAITTNVMLGDEWWRFFLCGCIGIATSIVFVYITQYYTSGGWRPVKEIADASRTGPATNIIIGTAVGLETIAATALTISIALVASFALGYEAVHHRRQRQHLRVQHRRLRYGSGNDGDAHVRRLRAFDGHVRADHRQRRRHHRDVRRARERAPHHGRARFRRQHHEGAYQGYAVASAGLAAFLLFSAYLDKVKERLEIPLNEELPIDLADIDVFAGGMIGAMLVFVFSSLAIRAVGSAAGDIIEEVRRQFREDPGIMAGTSRPDYGRAVDITARASLRNMIAPGVLAVSLPVIVGLVFRYARPETEYLGLPAGHHDGWLAVSGMLLIGTIVGIMMATFFNNVGGAWDNAKKYVEAGQLKDEHGTVLGKGSEAHKAAVVGDTVGDPFKDTAGPSLHVLIKLLATITLVMAPLFIP